MYGKYGCDDGMTDVMSDVFEYPGMKIDTVITGSRKLAGSGHKDDSPCKLSTGALQTINVFLFISLLSENYNLTS